MDKDYLKELLATNRSDKMILTYYLIATLGGTIGLIFRFLYIKQGMFELVLIILGAVLSCMLFYFISSISNRIFQSLDLLKNKKGE